MQEENGPRGAVCQSMGLDESYWPFDGYYCFKMRLSNEIIAFPTITWEFSIIVWEFGSFPSQEVSYANLFLEFLKFSAFWALVSYKVVSYKKKCVYFPLINKNIS